MQLHKDEIERLERSYRLNLINSISGIKPANLIGTRSSEGKDNVAIFSSVVHLGSSPAQLAFIMRPQTEIPRDTYPNIMETGFYTINHVAEAFIEKAHYTSAKLERGDSEFERMKLEKEFIADFHAPFVKESAVKIGMKHEASIPLPNGCIFVIGSVEMIVFPDYTVNELGQLNLEKYLGVGISGLNTYYGLNKLDSFPYVREDEIPDFE
ncbi:NADH-FMN oxidoreductase RutF, flavin reductase (DIM6/NTAB) family [Algoriphagus locisalis]|uniref:NADH-FMN oxidoreductase RutF, flavin reductase (DIM6/NTAB) family n=1 Tax=Algoriphagus locisalis TaxID=305507 RepID=A0A1I7BS29_9BACT|nr:flavin reductase [Algoriphagus locisalis]SFT89982.1 NADH-FMN oxidoreductase RutF, flavin reductase (DIM6/NTAB) family [Algoriphagus locisalis]